MEDFLKFISNKEVYGPVLTIIVAFVIYSVIKRALKRTINHGKKGGIEEKRRKTVVVLITNVIKIVTWIIVILIILNIYNINTTSVLASLGVASAVLGLAFQDALKDVIAGITIILENYFIVGDFIKYKDFMGEVVSFGFKSTKIKNFNNEILTVSNRNISEIINLSKEKAAVIINIPIAYEEDTEKVEKAIDIILKKIANDKEVLNDTCTYLGVNELDSSSVNYMIRFLCDHDKQWSNKRKALRIIKVELDKQGIKIPFNQIEVHNGKNI